MIGGLQLEGVCVSRDDVPVIADVTCRIAEGRWSGVIGANGSGKTTLLRAVAGRLPIAAGHLTIDGTDRTADRAWRARHIGFAPEGDALPGALSGAELFGILADGSSRSAAEASLRPLRTALDVDAIAAHPIHACSAGMRQRIAIFCAFVGGQRTVILDEPFNWLDPLAAFDVRAALRELVDGGLTLVTALHDLSTLASSCEEGLLMRDGEVALTLDAERLRQARRDPAAFERETIDYLRRQGGIAHGLPVTATATRSPS